MSRIRFKPALFAIFALAFAVRLLHVWQIRRAPFFDVLLGDSRGYDEWAQRIAAGDWIGREVFYQAPLYPYFLGVLYAIGGRHLLVVRIVQALLGSASCVFLALAARRFFSGAGLKACTTSEHTGLAAGLILALYAPAIFFDGLLQKSTLDVFFVCLSLWLISREALFPLGLAMGALALTRENAMVLIGVVALWMLWVLRSKFSVLSFVAGVAIVLVPVAARNAYVGGGFYVTTSQAGPNFYIGNNPKADGTYQSLRFGRGAPEYEREDATALAEHAMGRTLTPAEVSSFWTDRALDFVTSQPGAWLRLMGRKTALLWNAAEVVDTESEESHAEYSVPLRVLGWFGHFGVLVPLAVFGFLLVWRDPERQPSVALLAAMVLAYAASVVAFYVFARYRYPLVPLLILFAAAGVAQGFPPPLTVESGEPRRTRRSASAKAGSPAVVIAVAATAILSNWPMLSASMMRAVTETNLGAALQSEKRIAEAEAHYRRAIEIEPDYAPAYSNLGTALRAEGRIPDAIQAYNRALALQSEFPDAHYNLANALVDAWRPDEAIAHFQTALRSVPGSAEVHNNLGIALAARGSRDDAIAAFRQAVAADPSAPKSHRNLGDLLASAGQVDEALREFRRASELAPGDAAIHYDFGSLLLESGHTDEAAKEFNAALKLAPNMAEAHNNLGIALGSLGKLDEAAAEFTTALKLRPGWPDAQRNLMMLAGLRAQGKWLGNKALSPKP